MEKRNTLLLTVIAIATLLVAVVGATFAYFATTQDVNANVPVNIQTAAQAASFTAVTEDDINITVDAYEMQQTDADNDNQSTNPDLAAGLTDNATLTVKLSAAADGAESKCTYDIIYTWKSAKHAYTIKVPNPDYNAETNPSVPQEIDSTEEKYYRRTEGVTKEFTIAGTATGKVGENAIAAGDAKNTMTAVAEENFDQKTLQQKQITEGGETKTVDYFVLVSGASITSTSTTVPTEISWNFVSKFYNSTIDQSALMGKNFAGTISVDPDSIEC